MRMSSIPRVVLLILTALLLACFSTAFDSGTTAAMAEGRKSLFEVLTGRGLRTARSSKITRVAAAPRKKKRRRAAKNQTDRVLPAPADWLIAKQSGEPVQLIVNLAEQRVRVYVGDSEVASSQVSSGKAGYDTPTGIFSILGKSRYHRSNIYSNAPMPFMQRLTWSGIALHASNSVPAQPASHGCVRLPGQFAGQLFGFTERGGHVIITHNQVVPKPIDHAALFQPGAQYDPAADLRKVEFSIRRHLAKRHNPFDYPVKDRFNGDSRKPVRIYLTRLSEHEKLRDVQRLLHLLHMRPGEIDGYMGPNTGNAIKRFQKHYGLQVTGAMSDQVLTDLYRITGIGTPPDARIYVRQDFRAVFEADIGLADPQVPLGEHLLTIKRFDRDAGRASWLVSSISDGSQSRDLDNLVAGNDLDAAFAVVTEPNYLIAHVLDRFDIPQRIRNRISARLTAGSSIAISDTGISWETGLGTDFIVLTKERDQAVSG